VVANLDPARRTVAVAILMMTTMACGGSSPNFNVDGGTPPGADGGTAPDTDGGTPPGTDGGTPPGTDGGTLPGYVLQDKWKPGVAAPTARSWHVAVWTGSKMIVWGGVETVIGPTNDGAVFDSSTNAWTSISIAGAPSPRFAAAAVWTGSQMIVWGGTGNSTTPFGDGALYNPSTNTWKPMSAVGAPSARAHHAAVWTGSRMLVLGGCAGAASFPLDIKAYDPLTDSWSAVGATGAPLPRMSFSAIWTGSKVVVWGGSTAACSFGPAAIFSDPTSLVGTGASYNPVTGVWSPISQAGAPAARELHSGAWVGSRMIIWGGSVGGATLLRNDGRAYEPATDSWQSMTAAGAPVARQGQSAVATDTGMIVYAGWGAPPSTPVADVNIYY
jgi:hypothetical protein